MAAGGYEVVVIISVRDDKVAGQRGAQGNVKLFGPWDFFL